MSSSSSLPSSSMSNKELHNADMVQQYYRWLLTLTTNSDLSSEKSEKTIVEAINHEYSTHLKCTGIKPIGPHNSDFIATTKYIK